MTTHVRFDDATFADIQKRFREGRPSEAAKRKRHSRCDLIASLRTEIELLLSEGYSFEGIAEYLATLDVIIPVPTLKNYIGRARKKSGETRRQMADSDRRNSRTTTSEQPPKASRTRGREARHRQGDPAPLPSTENGPAVDVTSERASVAETQQSDAPNPLDSSGGTGSHPPADDAAPPPHEGGTPPDRRPLHQPNPAVMTSPSSVPHAPTGPLDLGGHVAGGAEHGADEPRPRVATAPGPVANTAPGRDGSPSATARDGEREPPLTPSGTRLEHESAPASPLQESSSSFAVPRRKRLEDL